MSQTKSKINSDINNNQVEFVENKLLLWLNKFWRFSFFYGDYLASLHSRKKN
jgi:hypothetical protein